MGTQTVQGSYSQYPGSSSQVQGSSSQGKGSSSQAHGSMDYPPRPPALVYQGFNIFQDQGSLRSVQPRSSEIHLGDFILLQTIASSGPSIVPESHQYGFTLGIPNLNPSGGNTLNTSYNANHGFVQDTGINQAMARELQKLKDMISNVPGVVKPILQIPDGSHKISRFAPPICDAEIPKRFQTPNLKL
ncbi:hypothetical protein HanIR_Chr12g0593971 [Helianthus annuus]|nr:hypothetical protein HanIR_Chr12g0593971 [Helianthus annuus]